MSVLLSNMTDTTRYILKGILHSHHGSVNCLKATEDGKILASRGMDGVKLWDLAKLAELPHPNGAGIHGATSALFWICQEDELGELLIFEEAAVFQMMDPVEVTGLVFDAAIVFREMKGSTQEVMAFGYHDGQISVVSGSDHGVVYVFDHWTGQTSNILHVDLTDWVQTVTVRLKLVANLDGFTVIIAARSRDWGRANSIIVWHKPTIGGCC
ncbi:hypothetical protein FB451DRAFT_1172841 [Mycena latifolia]|nr:hypothetical protein FB451DRAFT_1172841 [Mycena latifolia]